MLEKTESLKATHLLALLFLSNGCLSDFLPPFIPFHVVYKCWQNLPALVEVSLHLNSFFGCKTFILCFNFFFLGAKLLCSIYIDMRFFYSILLHFLFVFVFILFEHPWHAIDVFVRLPECHFNSAIILLPKKSILFYLGLFGNRQAYQQFICGGWEWCQCHTYWTCGALFCEGSQNYYSTELFFYRTYKVYLLLQTFLNRRSC